MIDQILEQMLCLEDADQRAYFYGWLKMAEKSVRESAPMPGQAVVFAGPRNAGKNFVQDLITAMLGGRVARPYQWIIGSTTFNADLFEAEHLMIADEVPFQDLASRRVFGSKIKDISVNSIQSKASRPTPRDNGIAVNVMIVVRTFSRKRMRMMDTMIAASLNAWVTFLTDSSIKSD